jgi:uncharacterized protein (TIGR01777 family)
MDVAVTGASGLIGSALRDALRARGDRMIAIGRGEQNDIRWDPDAGTIDPAALEGVAAVVHLAGEAIGGKKWTPEQKERIRASRIRGTDLIARTIAARSDPPSVFVSGSAIGWYGDRGDEELTEASPPPTPSDFLADVCVEWEAATAPAEAAGIRTVHVRTGVVLSAEGGVLKEMMTPFKLGLGGRVGSGRQYMSWVSIADEVGAILHAVDRDDVSGVVNVTGPEPVTNAVFTKALGAALHRPTLIPVPLAPLKALYGAELVEHLLVAGQRVLPRRLETTGYRFRHTTVEAALADLIG